MTVNAPQNDARISYTASGGETSFEYDFLILSSAHIQVRIDGTLKTLTTHYTLDDVGTQAGGTVTLVSPSSATAAQVWTLERSVPITRTSDFQTSGDYLAATVNTEQDLQVQILQELRRDIDRKLGLAVEDVTSPTLELPTDATSTAKYLLYSTSGFTLDPTITLPASLTALNFVRVNAGATAYEMRTPTEVRTAIAAQPLDATLTALAAYSTNGIVTQTASDTFAGRTIRGTANKITVTNGDGVSGNPTLTIPDAVTLVTPPVSGNLTVTGHLTINGTTVTNDATNTEVKDPLIEINYGAGSNASDLGLLMERGSTGDNVFMGWDESGDHFAFGTTTATGSSTGNISYSFGEIRASGAVFSGTSSDLGAVTTIDINGGTVDGAVIGGASAAAITGTTLTGNTSLALATGATVTGIADEHDNASDSAVLLSTQQAIKAYSDSNAIAPGMPMTWESDTDAADKGNGRIWLNHGTPSSATLLYMDDNLNNGSTDISALGGSLDDPTASNSAIITIHEGGNGGAVLVFKVSGAVTDLSTHQSVAVTHVATVGSFTDGDIVGVQVAYSGDNGSINNIVEDTTPQAGGDFDMNGNQMQWSQGADVQCANALPLLTDGNYFDITTGVDTVTSINATGGVGTLVKVHCDVAILWTHHSANLIIPGAANYQSAAGDELEFLEYAAGKYRCTGYALASGGSMVAAGGGGLYTWATNMTRQFELTDNTVTGTEGIGTNAAGSTTGVTATLVAGDEIVIDIGTISFRSSDGSAAHFQFGLYDGSTFYPGVLERSTDSGSIKAVGSGTNPDIMSSGAYTDGAGNIPYGNSVRAIYSQRALGLPTSEKVWQLGVKKFSGTGVIIRGSTDTAIWALGVRRETT